MWKVDRDWEELNLDISWSRVWVRKERNFFKKIGNESNDFKCHVGRLLSRSKLLLAGKEYLTLR